MQTAAQTQDLTQGSLSGHLVQLAAPLVVGNILQEFYNTIDALVVGRFAGQEEFAATGIGWAMACIFWGHDKSMVRPHAQTI